MGEPGAGEVWFYEHGNYGGQVWKFNQSQDKMGGANDKVSAIKLGPGTSVEIFVDSLFRGSSTLISQSTPSMPKGWNDKLSSFRILGAGTRGVIGEPTPAPAAAPAATPAPAAAPAAAPKGASLDHVPVVGQKIPGAVQNAIYDKAQTVNVHGINAGDLLNKIGGHAH